MIYRLKKELAGDQYDSQREFDSINDLMKDIAIELFSGNSVRSLTIKRHSFSHKSCKQKFYVFAGNDYIDDKLVAEIEEDA